MCSCWTPLHKSANCWPPLHKSANCWQPLDKSANCWPPLDPQSVRTQRHTCRWLAAIYGPCVRPSAWSLLSRTHALHGPCLSCRDQVYTHTHTVRIIYMMQTTILSSIPNGLMITYLADPFLTFAHRSSSHDVDGDLSTKVKVLLEKAMRTSKYSHLRSCNSSIHPHYPSIVNCGCYRLYHTSSFRQGKSYQ